MDLLQKYSLSLVLSVAMHALIIVLFALGFTSPEPIKEIIKPTSEIIQATVLDDQQVIAEAKRLQTAEKNKHEVELDRQRAVNEKQQQEEARLRQLQERRKQEEQQAKKLAEQRKKEEAQAKALVEKRKQQEKAEKLRQAALKKKQAEETARLEKIKQQQREVQRQLELQKQRAAEQEKQRKLAEQKRQQKILADQAAAQARQEAVAQQQQAAAQALAAQQKQATASATVAIQQKVNNHWIRPLNTSKGLNCTIQVKLLSSGDVMEAVVIRSSGHTIFDRSAENAVRKASPLPVPEDKQLFARKFRTFTFVFKPE